MEMDKVSKKTPITKAELHRRLKQFVIDSAADDATDPNIGPDDLIGGSLGVTPWIHIATNGDLFCLHADVRRSAVVKYLEQVEMHGDDIQWNAVLNKRGKKANAVAYGPQQIRITSFYLYLLDRPKRH